MFTDSQQNLWIGSVDQGYTVCYHYKERFNNDNYLRSELNNKSVVSLSAGKDHKLWISTLMDGIYVYDTKKSGTSTPKRSASKRNRKPSTRTS